jgi:predicted NACHT family NTPase
LVYFRRAWCWENYIFEICCFASCNGKIDKIPMFISLHEWTIFLHQNQQQDFDLIPFLVQNLICQFPQAENFILDLLSNGKALLLLDGLDEVNQKDNERSKYDRCSE